MKYLLTILHMNLHLYMHVRFEIFRKLMFIYSFTPHAAKKICAGPDAVTWPSAADTKQDSPRPALSTPSSERNVTVPCVQRTSRAAPAPGSVTSATPSSARNKRNSGAGES